MFVNFFIFLLPLQLVLSSDTTTPSVKINLGEHQVTVLGTKNLTWRGEAFYAFRGINYAKSPVGDLRFKDPQAITNYPDVIDAGYNGHDCPSIYATNASEDCLILNVYTKQLNSNVSLPVIAFIHPGGLYIGSSLSSFIGPEYLISHDIVLVTFNYRLGPLGFLNLGTAAVPGNAGFKDQIMALRWLKSHIKEFGGNPDDVTLMGYSAGATSVSIHLVSPMSQNLFHKAIIMSGAVPPQLLPKHEQWDLAIKQANVLNCNLSDKSDPRDCLEGFTGTEIANTLRRMFVFGKDNPICLWLPVIEYDFGQERFLVEDYFTSIESGNFNKVPLLISWTGGEFCTSAADIIKDSNLLANFNKEFDILAPKIFMYDNQPHITEINAAIKSHYFMNSSLINLDQFDELCDLFSDSIIRFGSYRLASLAAKFVSTTMFSFEYRGRYSNLEYPQKNTRPEHMDDLMYLFRMFPHHFAPDDEEASIVELMTSFIYKFAAYGDAQMNCTFPESHVIFNSKFECKNGNNFNQANFWNQLFPVPDPK